MQGRTLSRVYNIYISSFHTNQLSLHPHGSRPSTGQFNSSFEVLRPPLAPTRYKYTRGHQQHAASLCTSRRIYFSGRNRRGFFSCPQRGNDPGTDYREARPKYGKRSRVCGSAGGRWACVRCSLCLFECVILPRRYFWLSVAL